MDRDDLGFLLAKATQRWNELLQERFRAAGWSAVRPSYGSILVPLFEEDGLRIGELARRARLSKQTMTTMVRLLERDRLVRRKRDPDDGRAFRIALTAILVLSMTTAGYHRYQAAKSGEKISRKFAFVPTSARFCLVCSNTAGSST